MNLRQSAVALSPDEVEALCRQLQRSVQGEVRFDSGSRALYATDGSLYRQVPVGVVVPRTEDDVRQCVTICHQRGVPVLPRGAGTSLAGQCCNTAVVLDFSKYLNRILSIDPRRRLARVQPGCILDTLRERAQQWQLTFGPDPSTHTHNCLGGMLGNNSCGVHSIMAGRTADNVRSMRVLTGDGIEMEVGPTSEEELGRRIAEGGRRGEIYAGLQRIQQRYTDLIRRRYPNIPRRVSGYNLDQLLPDNEFNVARALVGSEGTCVTILEAELELVPSPPCRSVLVIGYEDVYRAADHIPEVLAAGPVGLEGIDQLLLDEMKLKDMHPEARSMLPRGGSWVFAEFGGDSQQQASEQARALVKKIVPVAKVRAGEVLRPGADNAVTAVLLVEDDEAQAAIWQARKSGLAATSRSSRLGDTWPGWEDAAVPPQALGNYLREFRQLLHRHGYEAALYGHFGDGCIHCRIDFDMASEAGVAQWRRFMHEAADLVVRHGGSLSGEHGDGQARAELLPKMYGETLIEAFREFKALFDPAGLMNPGKVVAPYAMDRNLRPDPALPLAVPNTHFAFSDDRHSYARAVDRCVGVGECRRPSGGVMCPSYRATMDEQHSTRGRARLLFEMLKGDAIGQRWRDDATREALDLCLACKGCKRDCPVGVDMATLKAEFMAHHYRRRLRPRAAYAMGLIWWWSRIATRLPAMANFLLQGPGYARQRFDRWFADHHPADPEAPRVLLWPDTFNNYFFPDTLKAAVRVLEAAGYRVEIPPRALCCGRPLYAEGMLAQARRQLGAIVDTLDTPSLRGLPVVGLEPSCVASFRDELPQLLPGDDRAQWLADHCYLLPEFLHRLDYHPRRLEGRALVHIHCHQHASLTADADRQLLARLGLEAEILDAGCCGMAGSFGFDAEKYPLSQRIGEQQLLPAVRRAAADTLIISNGFSCKLQIEQGTGRRCLHLAEVLAMALNSGRPAPTVLASTGSD